MSLSVAHDFATVAKFLLHAESSLQRSPPSLKHPSLDSFSYMPLQSTVVVLQPFLAVSELDLSLVVMSLSVAHDFATVAKFLLHAESSLQRSPPSLKHPSLDSFSYMPLQSTVVVLQPFLAVSEL